METATFAAEGIRDAEPAFRALDGVRATRVGRIEEPAFEALEVEYDPWQVSYDDLLEVLWAALGADKRALIFPHTVEQHAAASRWPLAEIVAGGGRFVSSAPS